MSPRIAYENWSPGADARAILRRADQICADYAEQGYDLTLRQLYYQFVARGDLPNTQQSYSKLGSIINRGRLAGYLDWDYIVDRTRNLQSLSHWGSPADIVRACARQFNIDKWATQNVRVEVWVEKEALAGVVGQAGQREDCAYFSCRGYVSQSELWGAAQRLGKYVEAGQRVVVLHLGDHDPSGIDMTRDIEDRLEKFTMRDYFMTHRDDFGDRVTVGEILDAMAARCGVPIDGGRLFTPDQAIEVRRIALNMDQVDEYQPPPNPAKLTDSRIGGYLREYGNESWELDALDPATLDNLITSHIEGIRDDASWEEAEEKQAGHRKLLQLVSSHWSEITESLSAKGDN